MKSEPPPGPPPGPLPEKFRRPPAVEPRLVDVTLPDETARGGVALLLVFAPAMSLNRLVVPRVAPILELLVGVPVLPDPLNAVALPPADDEPELLVLEPEAELEPLAELEGGVEPPELPLEPPDEPPPENVR